MCQDNPAFFQIYVIDLYHVFLVTDRRTDLDDKLLSIFNESFLCMIES